MASVKTISITRMILGLCDNIDTPIISIVLVIYGAHRKNKIVSKISTLHT